MGRRSVHSWWGWGRHWAFFILSVSAGEVIFNFGNLGRDGIRFALSFSAEIAVVEHFFTVRVKGPVVSFTWKDNNKEISGREDTNKASNKKSNKKDTENHKKFKKLKIKSK